jgi:hypothetical protein
MLVMKQRLNTVEAWVGVQFLYELCNIMSVVKTTRTNSTLFDSSETIEAIREGLLSIIVFASPQLYTTVLSRNPLISPLADNRYAPASVWVKY